MSGKKLSKEKEKLGVQNVVRKTHLELSKIYKTIGTNTLITYGNNCWE